MNATVFLLLALILVMRVESSTRCVTATGIVRCSKHPDRHYDVSVYLMDKDGITPMLQWLDPDDRMNLVHTNREGIFHLSGCANDPDILLGLYKNKPEPYLLLKHHCNTPNGEWIQLPIFSVFQPAVYDAGYIDLETNTRHHNSTAKLAEINQENGF
ncbi:hypothetical protein M3Y97_00003600 [Aphelenchoides bicaudatus]|nr:hypothetical protein M3Y97_00003600 [Aphelenchoides bicaudatus]